jgi:hypothetical protein
MTRPKRKLTSAKRAAKKRRKEEFQMVFLNGRQKWIRRRPVPGYRPELEFILGEIEEGQVEREASAPDDEEIPF